MEFSDLKASVRSRIWDAMTHNNWRELDDFSLILGDKIATKLVARRAVNIANIVSNTSTNFFTANSISRVHFVAEVRIALSDLTNSYRPLKKRKITKFKKSKDIPRVDFTDEVKRKVLRNQDSCCAICGNLMTVIDWDHKDGYRSNNDISNARALCPICHDKVSRKRQMGIRLHDHK
jgi:hypothetical protein